LMSERTTDEKEIFDLVLYVAGQTPKSLAAIANLRRICDDNIRTCFHVEVVDLQKDPQRAKDDQIVAIPTLVRKLPPPMKKIIGTLSDEENVLVGLNLRKHEGD
jgi:circadian clock protein KaiB